MKIRNIITYTLLSAAVLSAPSCLKNQQDYFNKTASARMQEALENAQKVLVGAENGWRMEYFTNYGGYNYAIRFNGSEADISSEMKPGQTVTSFYKMTTDDGPVLSFDTYNELIHFFATPSSSEYEGRGGDFEFIILSASPEKVELKGKRSGRYATLYPLDESIEEYTTKMGLIVKDRLVLGFDCDLDGNTEYSGRFDLMQRAVIFGRYDEDGVVIGEEQSAYFIYTENGFRLYEPIDVNGLSMSEFNVGEVPGPITTDNEKAKLTARPIPETYFRFEEYPGDYIFKAGGSSYDVTLTVSDEFGRELELTGKDETKFNYQFYLYYDVNTGQLEVQPQYIHQGDDVCEHGEYYVTLMGIDSKGSLTTSYYMKGVWTGDRTKPVINFVSGVETSTVVGFLLWDFNSDGFGEQYKDKDIFPNSLRPMTSLTKQN